MKRDGKIKITYSVFVFITFHLLILFYSTRVHSSSWEKHFDPIKNIEPTHLTRSSVIIEVGW